MNSTDGLIATLRETNVKLKEILADREKDAAAMRAASALLDDLQREHDELKLVHAHSIDPGEAQAREQALREELLKLQLRCGMCICASGTTDECCPQCIPNVPADIFQRYELAVKVIENVRAAGAKLAELDAFDKACGRSTSSRDEGWADDRF